MGKDKGDEMDLDLGLDFGIEEEKEGIDPMEEDLSLDLNFEEVVAPKTEGEGESLNLDLGFEESEPGLDIEGVVRVLELDISYEDSPGFNPFEDLYGDYEEDEEEFTVIEEEEDKLTPEDYAVEIIRDLIQFKELDVLGGKTFSSGLGSKIKVLLAKILRERGFDMKESTSISELVIAGETSGNYNASEVIQSFRDRFRPDASKLKALTYSLESIRNSYKRMIAEEKIREEKIQAPKKTLESMFMQNLLDVIGIYYEYSKNKLEIKYIRNITFSEENGYTFTCGSCGEEVGLKSSPLQTLIFPTEKRIKVLLKPIICNCDALNIMRKSAFQSLDSGIKAYYKSNVVSWSERDIKLSSIVNFMKYEPRLQDLGMDGLVKVESEDFTQEEEQLDFLTLKTKMDQKFKESLKLSSNLHKVKYSVESSNSLEEDTADKSVVGLPVYRDMAKYLSLLSKERYTNLIEMARGSLYVHLKETPSFFYALFDKNPRVLAIEESEKLFLRGGLSPQIRDRIARSLGIFDSHSDQDIIEGFSKLKEDIRREDSDREYILSMLETSVSMFMVLPIRDFNYNGELEGITGDRRILDWIDKVTNLMVVSHLIPNFYFLWGGKSYGKSKNDTLFNEKKEPWDSRIKHFCTGLANLKFIQKPGDLGDLVLSLAESTGNSLITESIGIKNAISKRDYVSFMDKVSLITKPHGSFLAPFHEEFKEHTVAAHKLFFEFEDEDKEYNYYHYYYGDKFTEKEIRVGILELFGERVSPLYEVPKEEGETFSSYLQRVKRLNGQRCELESSPHVKFFNKLSRLSFNLSALTAVASFREMHGQDQFKRLIFLCETIYRFPRFNLETIYRYLGLPTPSVDVLGTIPEYEETIGDSTQFLDMLIESVIFDDEGINAYRDTHIESPNLYLLLKEEEGLDSLIDSVSYSTLLEGLMR